MVTAQAVKLNKTLVDSLEAKTKKYVVLDGMLKGFGVKVTPAGSKIFLVQYRPKTLGVGERASVAPRTYTIGAYGPLLTVDQARTAAAEFLTRVQSGIDPVAVKREAEQSKAESEMQRAAEQEKAQKRTFAAVCQDYLEADVRGRLVRASQTESILTKQFTGWHDRDIASITRADVEDQLRNVERSGKQGAAKKYRAELSAFLSYAVRRGLIPFNPALGRKLLETTYKPRERALEFSELFEVWDAAGKMAYPACHIMRLLILTGLRREEATGARWEEFDLDKGIWTIPAERMKGGKASHVVHLTPQILDIFLSAAVTLVVTVNKVQLNPADNPIEHAAKITPFCFTTTLESSFSGFSRAKEIIDRHVTKARANNGFQPMPHWTPHDLRRTLSTRWAELGVPQLITELVLDHTPVSRRGIAGVYNHFEHLDDRKVALENWSALVASGTAPPKGYKLMDGTLK